MAERHTSVVHCPSSNLKLASGFAPVARLLAAGVNVALGTDGAASNNSLDLFAEMRTAAAARQGGGGDASALPAEQALALATINGARALGTRRARSARWCPAKSADLICVDLREAATQPVHHVISQLVYSASRHQVTDAWVAGRHVLAGGQADTHGRRRDPRPRGRLAATAAPEHDLAVPQRRCRRGGAFQCAGAAAGGIRQARCGSCTG